MLFGTRWVTCYRCWRRRRPWFTRPFVGAAYCVAEGACSRHAAARRARLERTASGALPSSDVVNSVWVYRRPCFDCGSRSPHPVGGCMHWNDPDPMGPAGVVRGDQ